MRFTTSHLGLIWGEGEGSELASVGLFDLTPSHLHHYTLNLTDWIACGLAIFRAKQKNETKMITKPTKPDQPFEVQHGSSPQALSPAALHPSEVSPKSDKNVQASSLGSHRTRSAVEVQHGSSPQAISPAALHPSEASPKSD